MSTAQINFLKVLAQDKTKIIIILRGLPGCGKSTLANKLIKILGFGKILSTDDYFTKNDMYQFYFDELPSAHSWNKLRTESLMKDNEKLIIIDNTNMAIWEMDPYIQLGRKYNYYIYFVEPDTWFKNNNNVLSKKNIHGVTKSHIQNMKLKFEKFDQADLNKFYPELLSSEIVNFNNIKPNSLLSRSYNNYYFQSQENLYITPPHLIKYHSLKAIYSNLRHNKTQTTRYDFEILDKVQRNQVLGLQRLTIKIPDKHVKHLLFPNYINTYKRKNIAIQTEHQSAYNNSYDQIYMPHVEDMDLGFIPNKPILTVKQESSWDSDTDENFWAQSYENYSGISSPNKSEKLEDKDIVNDENSLISSPIKLRCLKDLIPSLDQIKPFYPDSSFIDPHLSAPTVSSVNYDQDFQPPSLTVSQYNQTPTDQLPQISPNPMPLWYESMQPQSTPIILDKEFLINMQAQYNIPPKPFSLESLEFFERSLTLEPSLAQKLYFQWVATQEMKDPAFKETFYDDEFYLLPTTTQSSSQNIDSTLPQTLLEDDHLYDPNEYRYPNYNNITSPSSTNCPGDLNVTQTTTNFDLASQDFPDCSCYLNPHLKNKLLANNWNILKPKPFNKLLEEAKTKLEVRDNAINKSKDFNPTPIATQSILSELVPDITAAKILKRTILSKKFPDIDAHLLDEIFAGFEFDEIATIDFIQSNITPMTLMLDPGAPKYNDVIKYEVKQASKIDVSNDDSAELDLYEDTYDEDFLTVYKTKPIFPPSPKPDIPALLAINKNMSYLFNSNPQPLSQVNLLKSNTSSTSRTSRPDNSLSTNHRNHIYDIFREPAFNLQSLRNDYLEKALNVSTSTNKHFRAGIAEYYRQTAREFDEKSKGYNEEALWNILRVNNYGNAINTLDLHGLHVSEVLPLLKRYLSWAQDHIVNDSPEASKLSKLTIITGRGKSKSSQHSRLNYIVKNYLHTKGYPPFEEPTPGTFTLYLVKKYRTNRI